MKSKKVIDASKETIVVMCPDCDWRDIQLTRSRAWFSLATHLKRTHNDPIAAARATQNFHR